MRLARDARFASLVAGAILSASALPALASPPIDLLDVTGGNGGFVINGTDVGDSSGASVSGAGDVNGDGVPDLIVGAPWADPGGVTKAGKTYVVFGKPDGAAVELASVAAGTGGFVINGIDALDYSGDSVSAAGDVNGDGLADLIIGAYEADPGGRSRAGESYVVFGKADDAAVELAAVAAGDGGFVINGITPLDYSGSCVSSAGDVNGDGLADLIVGALWANPGGVTNAGQSYVVFGKAEGAAVELASVAAGTGGFVINGANQHDLSGASVSGAGDVNGDGLADLIVGAHHADPGGDMHAGETYVVFGKADGNAVELGAVAAGAGGFVVNGIDPVDLSGISVSGAKDVNGDGLADLIIGARGADPDERTSAGESYVVFGKADGDPIELEALAEGTGGFVINGIDLEDESGFSVSSAGDVNGDGLADLFVGAPYAGTPYGDPAGRYLAGESYVVFGKANAAAVELSAVAAGTGGFVVIGVGRRHRSGGSVSGTGDVNGDGLADLIVGAPSVNAGGSNSGASYVIFSPEAIPESAIYRMTTLAGDGIGPFVAPATDFGDVARVKIDFSDDDYGRGGGLRFASRETVTIRRDASPLSNLNSIPLQVYWHIDSDRGPFSFADVTLKYLDAEVAAAGLDEAELRILAAPEREGPWTQLPTTRRPVRNELEARVEGFGFFAIAQAMSASQTWPSYP